MKNNPEKDPIFIRQLPPDKKNRCSRSLYTCGYCGKEFEAKNCEVISGHTRSCGCLRRSRRADHTNRVLTAWGNNKTLWVAQRFLSHSRLQPRPRAAADAELMKTLDIKDRDILFKAVIRYQESTQQAPGVQSTQLRMLAPPPKQPLVEHTHTTIINVQGDLHMSTPPKPRLEPQVPYELTAAGQAAIESYYWQHHQYPPEDFDLRAWASVAHNAA